MKMGFLFTSESVSEGHPDKVSDQISDAILDEFLRRDANSKVACETLCTTGLVVVAGEVRSEAYVDVQGVARRVINRIGYTRSDYQFDGNSCGILSAIHEQSSDINQGVVREAEEEQGAGDQGIMFGYACNETREMMPATLILSHVILKELAVIRRNFYRTLAEIFVDTVNMAHMGEEKARTVLTVKGFDEHYKAVHGRDWIAMTAHFGCWEYCSYWGLYERSQMLVAVYHPLRSKVMERLYQRLRNYENSMTVAMKDSLRFYLRNRECGVDGKNLVMGLIADQNPPRRPDSHWFRFLNQDTIFFDGGEKLALRCKLPVYFVRMDRLRRGRYQMSFEPIYDGEEQVAEYEITERYVRKLEAMISEHPELWMWSHRRWKHKRTNAGR